MVCKHDDSRPSYFFFHVVRNRREVLFLRIFWNFSFRSFWETERVETDENKGPYCCESFKKSFLWTIRTIRSCIRSEFGSSGANSHCKAWGRGKVVPVPPPPTLRLRLFPRRGPRKQSKGPGGLSEAGELRVNPPNLNVHNAVCLQICWFRFQSCSGVSVSSPLRVIRQVQAPRCAVQTAHPRGRQLRAPEPAASILRSERLWRDSHERRCSSHGHRFSPGTPEPSRRPRDKVSRPQSLWPRWFCLPHSRIPAVHLLSPLPKTGPSALGPWDLWSRVK